MFPTTNLRTFVLFDLDGVLVDSAVLGNECLADYFGVDAISTNWESYQHATDPGVFMEIFESYMDH
jgi:hypothetical protein